jgi:guanosine-3',5'-bis(diphosphate) 3'-pyrophosphohydrolase
MPKADTEDDEKSLLNKLMGRVRKKKVGSGVIVKGVEDMLVRFGKCCQPVPGDDITGYITRGFGVTVHRVSCPNMLKTNPERHIDVQWDADTVETFPAKIRIRSIDRMGLLADVASSISKYGANILSAKTETHENKMVDSYFTIAVEDIEQLEQVVTGLKKIKQVLEVFRVN